MASYSAPPAWASWVPRGRGAANRRRTTLEGQLLQAIQSGDRLGVSECLANGANPNMHVGSEEDFTRISLLMYAAKRGDVELVVTLLAAGADVNAASWEGWSTGEARWSALAFAASGGNADVVRALINAGADVHWNEDKARGPLLLASISDHWEAARELVAAGADVNAADRYGWSPLLFAARGDENAVRLLLQAGANVNQMARDGWTPIACASARLQPGILRQLLAAGAPANPVSGRGPLHAAAETGLPLEVAHVLLEAGADVNAREGRRKLTPLHCAAALACVDAVRILLANGADVNATDSNGSTALESIRPSFQPDAVVRTLLSAGATCTKSWLAKCKDSDKHELFALSAWSKRAALLALRAHMN